MADDMPTRRPRPPQPPPLPREERPIPEKIAKIALQSKPADLDSTERLLRAIAASEGKLKADLANHRESFEEEMRLRLNEIVLRELPRVAASTPPPPAERRHWYKPPETSWVASLPPLVIAIGALIGTIAQNCSRVPPEVTKKLEKHDTDIAAISSALALKEDASTAKTKRQEAYRYEIDARNWVADVFEQFGVKVDDPAGAPPRAPLEYYPAPLNSHRLPKAPGVQPHAPYPVPPEP